jgi:hypothetical protein
MADDRCPKRKLAERFDRPSLPKLLTDGAASDACDDRAELRKLNIPTIVKVVAPLVVRALLVVKAPGCFWCLHSLLPGPTNFFTPNLWAWPMSIPISDARPSHLDGFQ